MVKGRASDPRWTFAILPGVEISEKKMLSSQKVAKELVSKPEIARGQIGY